MTQPLSPLALEVRALEKRFDHPAVDGLDLSVPAGEFFTLLGPNGAGKTTTLRLVTGLLKPDRGSIAVYGIDALADPIAARRIMAWVSDEPMIYDYWLAKSIVVPRHLWLSESLQYLSGILPFSLLYPSPVVPDYSVMTEAPLKPH